MHESRQLKDLAGVGPATLADLRILGIHSVTELSLQDGKGLYDRLCLRTGKQHDICCLDVFNCAIAQARDSRLPKEQRPVILAFPASRRTGGIGARCGSDNHP